MIIDNDNWLIIQLIMIIDNDGEVIFHEHIGVDARQHQV